MYSPIQSAKTAGAAPQKSFAHRALLALIALAVCSGAVVFSEPAPVDALMLTLLILLPAAGLVTIKPAHLVFLSVWLVIAGGAFISSVFANDTGISVTHTSVSLYLFFSAFLFAVFIAKNPVAHTRLILSAYSAAAIAAAVIGLIGYFDLVPGSAEYFTKFGRATGPFKDPNVFGAFLTLAVVKVLHDVVTQKGMRALIAFASFGLLMLAVLLSFSRGAWSAAAVAIIIYGCLSFATAKKNIERVKLLSLGLACVFGAGLVLTIALQSDSIADLLEQRASVAQSYDEGPDGRFGGQQKARSLILENPLGIGALTFARVYHNEDVHNVYLSTFLNAGWLGGFFYLAMAGVTMILGLRHAFKRTATQPYFIVAYAALVAMLLEGSIIDTDHWRHFYLLIGVVWGLMIADRKIARSSRIVADRRPILLSPVLLLPPPRRSARALRPARIALPAPRGYVPFPSRAPRLVGPSTQRLLRAPNGMAS